MSGIQFDSPRSPPSLHSSFVSGRSPRAQRSSFSGGGGPVLHTSFRASDAVGLAHIHGAGAFSRLSTPDIAGSQRRVNTPRLGNFSGDSGRVLMTTTSFSRVNVRVPASVEAATIENKHTAMAQAAARRALQPRRASPWSAQGRPWTSSGQPVDLPQLQRVFATRRFDAVWRDHPSNPSWPPPGRSYLKSHENQSLAGARVASMGMATRIS